jgi:hypothetical protein
MKCSKLIDILQQLEYELDDPNVVIRLCDEYDPEVAIDFNYANQFVAGLLPEKLSDDILESIKAALIKLCHRDGCNRIDIGNCGRVRGVDRSFDRVPGRRGRSSAGSCVRRENRF